MRIHTGTRASTGMKSGRSDEEHDEDDHHYYPHHRQEKKTNDKMCLASRCLDALLIQLVVTFSVYEGQCNAL